MWPAALYAASSTLISTIAGTGGSPEGEVGRWGTSALSAQFNTPLRVMVDPTNNLYITDYLNQSIRVVSNATDIVNSIAGNGSLGFSGDGGSSMGAQLADPHDVVLDKSGNVYIADTLNARIRIINTSGIISTFAGIGTHGYSGDGGPASQAQLYYPAGLAIDASGNLYIADFGNATVRKVSTNGVDHHHRRPGLSYFRNGTGRWRSGGKRGARNALFGSGRFQRRDLYRRYHHQQHP